MICPTVERRFHAGACVDDLGGISARIPGALDLDGERGHLTMATEDEQLLGIDLDGWR